MAGLAFLSPWFLLGALAAIVPLALHLFRRETAPVEEFSAVRFVRATAVEQKRQRRLRDVLLLALRVAAVLALTLAFARPYIHGRESSTSRVTTVVALDVSASMGAPATWAEARRAAREAVTSAAPGRVGLVTFSDTARTVVEPVDDRAAVLAALDRISPGSGGTRLEPGVASAAGLVGAGPGGVVVVSDLQEWALNGGTELPAGVALRVEPVPVASVNVAVTSLVNDGADALVAVVENEGRDAFTGQVSFDLDGRRIGSAPVTVPPRSSAPARLRAALPQAGVASAAVVDTVGPQADNRRVLVLDRAARVPVLVVAGRTALGDPSVYVRSALDAVAGDQVVGLATEVAAPVDTRLAERAFIDSFRAVFLLDTRGMSRPARDALGTFLENGGGLFVAAGPDVDPRATAGLVGAGALSVSAGDRGAWPARLAAADTRHPVVAALGPLSDRLVHVRVDRGVRLDPSPATRVVARFTNGWPALVEARRGGGRAFVFASDLGRQWNSFPLQASFPPFIYEVAKELVGSAGAEVALTAADVDGQTAVPGVVTRGTPGRRVAVNVDPRESRLATSAPEAIATAFPSRRAVASTLASPLTGAPQDALWRALVLALAVVLGVEAILSAARGAAVPVSGGGPL